MNHSQTYAHYPIGIVLVCNLVSWALYAIGAAILGALWIWLLIPYLAYVLWLEVRLLKTACVDCAYYGSVCAFGRGKLCAAAFQRGDPQRFGERRISWTEVLPDFLVSIIPLIGGIVLLALNGWSWLIVGLLILLLVLASVGNGFVRGSFACKHCRQGEIGCSAYDLFGGQSGD